MLGTAASGSQAGVRGTKTVAILDPDVATAEPAPICFGRFDAVSRSCIPQLRARSRPTESMAHEREPCSRLSLAARACAHSEALLRPRRSQPAQNFRTRWYYWKDWAHQLLAGRRTRALHARPVTAPAPTFFLRTRIVAAYRKNTYFTSAAITSTRMSTPKRWNHPMPQIPSCIIPSYLSPIRGLTAINRRYRGFTPMKRAKRLAVPSPNSITS